MTYQTNRYYQISDFGSDALLASEALLKSYPLSKVCLDILGKPLLKSLEFGFFEPGYPVIRQGEQGKELFLLCNHIADVIVLDKVIVQMEAPTLFGDKAIIDRNSTRKATISVAAGGQALVIKIPMGRFLRDFKRGDIDDAAFKQERQVYYNLFLEIQRRLFKYSEIQRELWDEVNKQLKLLNVQLVGNALSKKEDKQWEPKVWQVVVQYLKSVHGLPWPDNVAYSVPTLIDILQTIQEKRFPRSKFKGSERSYHFKKQTIWQRWLETLSELLIKVLPNNQLPISIGDVELFNPRIYQMRMHTLLVSIQRKFMFKKVMPREDRYDSDKLKARQFFSGGKTENEFNLDAYLNTLKEMFLLKNPNRVLAQVAQQTAQLSATCEDEFNTSVSKMKHLLEKVKKLSKINMEIDDEQTKAMHLLKERIDVINQGFKAYNSRIVGHTYTYAGVIRFNEGKVPLIKDVIKTCGSDLLKKKLRKSYVAILDQLGLKPEGIASEHLQDLFFLCQGNSEDIIPTTQLTSHYWIPVSEGISLRKGNKRFGPVRPGHLIGGQFWQMDEDEQTDKQSSGWQLQMPQKTANKTLDDMFLILVIPRKRIPWVISRDPSPDDLQSQYLPLLQWILNKHVESIAIVSELRDSYLKKYARVVAVVVTEKKVRDFESNSNRLPQEKYNRILKLVYDVLGINLEKKQAITPEKLSKEVYNEIIRQTKRDYPKLSTEEQGNKAYTLWRFIQSEIVSKVFADEFKETDGIDPPRSVFLDIQEALNDHLDAFAMTAPEGAFVFTEDNGEIDLARLIQTEQTALPHEALSLALSTLEIVEQHLMQLMDDTNNCLARLKQISSIQTEFNVNDIQSKFILDAIAKLQYVLQHGVSA